MLSMNVIFVVFLAILAKSYAANAKSNVNNLVAHSAKPAADEDQCDEALCYKNFKPQTWKVNCATRECSACQECYGS